MIPLDTVAPVEEEQLDLTQFQSDFGYQTFVATLAKDGEAIVAAFQNPSEAHLLHMAIGIAGEVSGELLETATLCNAQYRYNAVNPGSTKAIVEMFDKQKNLLDTGDKLISFLLENIDEELGDIGFYLTGLTLLGFCLDDDPNGEWKNHPQKACEGDCTATLLELTIASGYLLDAAKRVTIYEKGIEALREKIQEATTRTTIAYLKVIEIFGLDPATIRSNNVSKLAKRYEGVRYSNDAANARADKAPGH